MKKVVVTGLGVVSSVGIGKDDFWANIIKGKSGIGKVSLFDTSRFNRHNAGEIKDFRPDSFISPLKSRFLGRASQMAIAAVMLALKDAGISVKALKTRKTAVILGVTMPEGSSIDFSSEMLLKNESGCVKNRVLLNTFAPSVAHNIGNFFRLSGNNLLIPNACAAGNYTIGYGFDLIKKGEIDLAIVGGAEALSRIAFQGFQRLYAMAAETCAPFDLNRQGMLLGEGAGILILESAETALKRRIGSYAEVLGYGLSCDAHHITIPKIDGVKKAMEKAIKNAQLLASDVDYICAHGTGTPANDKAEAEAIMQLFGQRYKKIAVNSIKSMLGHAMGAASAIEAISCCLTLKNGIIPPTINFKTPDPECDIDCVPNEARSQKVRYALNNAFAFGGNNSCVVFKGR